MSAEDPTTEFSIYSSALEKIVSRASRDGASIRKKAFDRFLSRGFPSKKTEDWRYLDSSGLKNPEAYPVATVSPLDWAQISPRIVIRDGAYSEAESDSVNLQGLNILLLTDPPAAALDFDKENLDGGDDLPIWDLNTALSEGATGLIFSSSYKSAKPLTIVHVSSKTGIRASRVHIVLEQEAAVELIERSQVQGSFVNAVTTMALGTHSFLGYARVSHPGDGGFVYGGVFSELETGARLESFVFSAEAPISRQMVRTVFRGPHASAKLLGLSLASGKEHIDHLTVVDHRVEDCKSEQTYKSIVGGQAKYVFNGKILVAKKAQKTDSHQMSKNLVIGSKAEVNTRPQLEIFADDVKASHGATVGRLNPEEVFYLQTRGIQREHAIRMLSYGFAEDTLNGLTSKALRAELHQQIAVAFSNFEGELA